jgi:hypothetical protein
LSPLNFDDNIQHLALAKQGGYHGQIKRYPKRTEEKTPENSQREKTGKTGKETEEISIGYLMGSNITAFKNAQISQKMEVYP